MDTIAIVRGSFKLTTAMGFLIKTNLSYLKLFQQQEAHGPRRSAQEPTWPWA